MGGRTGLTGAVDCGKPALRAADMGCAAKFVVGTGGFGGSGFSVGSDEWFAFVNCGPLPLHPAVGVTHFESVWVAFLILGSKRMKGFGWLLKP